MATTEETTALVPMEEEVLEDEMDLAFDEVENSSQNKVQDYTNLLKHVRTDDHAVKIKEKCIYK